MQNEGAVEQLCAMLNINYVLLNQLAYSGQVTQVQSFMNLTCRTCNIESSKKSVSVKCLLQREERPASQQELVCN